jgi:hypothetical protein
LTIIIITIMIMITIMKMITKKIMILIKIKITPITVTNIKIIIRFVRGELKNREMNILITILQNRYYMSE